MRPFTFTARPIRVTFGIDTLKDVGKEIEALSLQRVIILATPEQGDLANRVANLIGNQRVALVHAAAKMHTPVEVTEGAIRLVKEHKVDGLVAVGGGSSIGLSKAIAYRTGLPQLAIPTTYAGSEATTILGQTENKQKKTLKHENVAVRAILYDVRLTETLPLSLCITSGINAMAHAVEALYSSDANPIIDQMAFEGIRIFRTQLPELHRLLSSGSGDDANDDEHMIDVRSDLLYAAWLCGTCLGAVGMGLRHKLCHTLGGMLDTPHAQTRAIVLPHALQYNFASLSVCVCLLLLRALLGDNGNLHLQDESYVKSEQASIDASKAVYTIVQQTGQDVGLQALGVQESDMARVAEAAANTTPYPNPTPLDAKRLTLLLQRAWKGEEPSAGL